MGLLKSTFIYILLSSVVLSFAWSCSDEEFTTSPNSLLEFSVDTINMDTLFTTIGSSTRKLMVYNKHSKAINISNIKLINAGKSGFVINVDGMSGAEFANVEIASKDSIYIFIEAKLKETSQDKPVRMEDVISFGFNGVMQSVVLEAYAQDAYMWRGKVIESDTTLTSHKPILIYDSLYIAQGAQLKMEAGTRLFLHNATSIKVDGRIVSEGELGNPVVIRGDRTDKLFSNLPYSKMPGQWGGIHIKSLSYGNSFNYTNIKGMDWGIKIDSADVDQLKLKLTNCILRYSNKALIDATNAKVVAGNCEFALSGGSQVYIKGGKHSYTQCTFANYFPFGVSSEPSIVLTNQVIDLETGSVKNYDLLQADFNNNIIWGNKTTEVGLRNVDGAGEFAHRFDHCLIKAKGKDDDDFIEIQWNVDPKFAEVDEVEYLFDFRIDSLSGAIEKGSPEYIKEYPLDILGNPRLAIDVDLGAYQWVGERP